MDHLDTSALTRAVREATAKGIALGVRDGLAQASADIGEDARAATKVPREPPFAPPKEVASAGAKRIRKPATKPMPAKKSVPTASARPRGDKRTPDEMAQLVERLAEHIASAHGQGVEQIAIALGVRSKELALPMKKLLAARRVKSTGAKRATKYFPT